jgi:hypothetical protein
MVKPATIWNRSISNSLNEKLEKSPFRHRVLLEIPALSRAFDAPGKHLVPFLLSLAMASIFSVVIDIGA